MAKKAAKKRKYSRSSGSDVKSEMRRYKKGTTKSGRGSKAERSKAAMLLSLPPLINSCN